MNVFYKILILLFSSGATSGIAQAVLAREIGNQASLNANLMLFTGLSWFAGAVIAFQAVKKMASGKAPEKNLNFTAALMPVLNAFYITGAVVLARYFKPALQLGPDAAAPDWAAMALCGAIFIPISFMVFASVWSLMEALKKSKAPGFLMSSAASVAGGAALATALYWFWAVKSYSGLDVAYTMGVFNLVIAYLFFRDKTIEGRWLMLTVIGALILYLGFNMAGTKQKVDEASAKALYSGYAVIAQKEYPTVNFCMAKKGDEYRIYEDGTLAYKIPDPKFTLIARMVKGPRVLVINGGLSGMNDALAKNATVKEIVCVESDPYVAVVLEKVYRSYIQGAQKIDYVSANGTYSIAVSVKDKGSFDTVVINPVLQGRDEGKYYFSPAFRVSMDKMLKKDGQIIYGGNQ